MATITDRRIVRGDDDSFSILFKDNSGNLLDLTNYTVWFTVRRYLPSTAIESDTDATISIMIDYFPNLGTVSIELTSEMTDIDSGNYYYDIQYKKPNGKIKSTGYFKFTVVDDVTRSR